MDPTAPTAVRIEDAAKASFAAGLAARQVTQKYRRKQLRGLGKADSTNNRAAPDEHSVLVREKAPLIEQRIAPTDRRTVRAEGLRIRVTLGEKE